MELHEMVEKAPDASTWQGAEETSGTLTILTISFSGDFELCKLLCETVDRFVPRDVAHVLAVPRSDLALFAPLCNDRRSLVVQEDYLPRWLRKVPLPSPRWRKWLFLPRRDVFLALPGRLLRGWIVQQILKLACVASISSDGVLLVDSDAAFVRPLTRDHLFVGDRLRLEQFPGGVDAIAEQQVWYDEARSLLGLTGAIDGPRHGYIQCAVVWSPRNVRALLAHIEKIKGINWQRAIASGKDFSEYILYGVFCEKILGEEARHYTTSSSLSYTIWSEEEGNRIASAMDFARSLKAEIGKDQPVLAIQSTIAIGIDTRRAVVEALT